MPVEYTPYTFLDAERLRFGRYPMLDIVGYRWARRIEESLYDETGVEVYTGASTFEEMRFSTFFQSMRHPRPIYFFSLENLPGQGLLVMDNRFSAFCLTRRVQQRLTVGQETVRLTPDNQARLQQVVERLMRDFDKSWEGIQPVRSHLRRMTTHPFRSRVLGPYEPCLVAQIHLSGRGLSSRITWCIPRVMFEPFVDQLKNRRVLPPLNPHEGPLRHFRAEEVLGLSRFRVPIQMGRIDPEHLMAPLKEGDILPLNNSVGGQALLSLGGEPVMRATVGQLDDQKVALRLEGRYIPQEKKKTPPDPAMFKTTQWPDAGSR